MKSVILSLILGLGVALAGVATSAFADQKPAAHKTKKKTMKRAKSGKVSSKKGSKKVSMNSKPAPKKESLSTDVKFSDGMVHGQYQTPDEALANVENEKSMNDLIGVRKHFKDRLATASEQE